MTPAKNDYTDRTACDAKADLELEDERTPLCCMNSIQESSSFDETGKFSFTLKTDDVSLT